jgi:hypothetical protein
LRIALGDWTGHDIEEQQSQGYPGPVGLGRNIAATNESGAQAIKKYERHTGARTRREGRREGGEVKKRFQMESGGEEGLSRMTTTCVPAN